MRKILFVVALVAVLGVTANAYSIHCWNAGEIKWAAHRLDRAAEQFHEVIHHKTGYSHLADDVHDLAAEARRLHRIADREGSCRRISEEFIGVRDTFRHVDLMVERAHRVHHRGHVIRDWFAVKDAYLSARSAVTRGSGRN